MTDSLDDMPEAMKQTRRRFQMTDSLLDAVQAIDDRTWETMLSKNEFDDFIWLLSFVP